MRLYDARFREAAYENGMAAANATSHAPNSHEWWDVLKAEEKATMERLVLANREAKAAEQRSLSEMTAYYRRIDGDCAVDGDWGSWRTFKADMSPTRWTLAHFQDEGSNLTACGRDVPTAFEFEHANEIDSGSRRCKHCERALGLL
tara:strand:- start:524 stop:961 length:438 start_codon:yes stop_codon:yes gene_type:complete